MKRLIVIFTFALLLISAGKSNAGCYARYYRYGHPAVVVYRGYGYHRAWIPGYWQWNWRYRSYYWVPGYWY